jgi:hypothetical protein
MDRDLFCYHINSHRDSIIIVTTVLAAVMLPIDLHAQTNVSVKDILDLLNDPPEAGVTSPLWIGDGFYETNCAVVNPDTDVEKFSQRLRLDRQLAARKVRLCIDEWIDSGKTDDKEAACNRIEDRAPQAAFETIAFWETSQIVAVRSRSGSSLRLLPRDRDDFESAGWKARRIVALVLSSDLRLRIAKCRYEKCKRPYFLLSKTRKTYEHGLYCCVEHNRSTTAPRRVQKRRSAFDAKLITWAAGYVNKHATDNWQEDLVFKEKLAAHLTQLAAREKAPARDNVTKNWVTRNWPRIQAEATFAEKAADRCHDQPATGHTE